MSRIFKALYEDPELHTPVETREAALKRTLKALRTEDLPHEATPEGDDVQSGSFPGPSPALDGQQPSRSAAGPTVAPQKQRYSGLLRGETFHLVRRLFLTAADGGPRAVVFCTVGQDHDCNWVSAQVAELLSSHTGTSVCMVDAHVNKPSLHRYFGLENGEGLLGAIRSGRSIRGLARRVGQTGLHLIPAGTLSYGADSDILASSGQFERWIAELRTAYPYVVINSAPAPGSFITSHVAALTDGAILVVQPSFTTRQAARQAKEEIEAAGGRLLAAVLWRRTQPFSRRSQSFQ